MPRLLRITLAVGGRLFPGVAIVLAVLWGAGRIATDRYAWSQWLWWIPTPVVILACLLAMVSSAGRPAGRSRRGRALPWGMTAVVLTIYFGVIEHRLIGGATPRRGALRIVHWNIPTGRDVDVDACAEAILRWGGDISIITSYTTVTRSDTLRVWLGERHPIQRWPFTILSRLPVGPVEVILREEDLCLVSIECPAPELGRPLRLLAVDLPSDPKLSRYATARRVRTALSDAAPFDVVVGDFNATRGSASIAHMFPTHRHAFDDAGRGYAATFRRGDWRLFHIDHALVGRAVTATRYELIDPGFGRHMAQVIEVDPIR